MGILFSPRWKPAVIAVALSGSGLPVVAAESAPASKPATFASPFVAASLDAPLARLAEGGEEKETEYGAAPSAPLHWSASTEISSGSYRWSLSRGAFDMGVGFDVPGGTARASESRFERSEVMASPLPSLRIGLRRIAPRYPTPAGAMLQRAADPGPAEPSVSKVGVEWKPAQSQVHFLREGLGIRLDGSDRMTVRLRKGVLGLYMQRTF